MYKENENSYSDKQFAVRVTIATILVAVIVNMGLNTLWTSITTGKAFMVLFTTRIIKQLIMIPIHISVTLFLEKVLRKPYWKYLRNNDD